MINTDLYVEVAPGTAVSYDVRVVDEEVEFIIGSRVGHGSSLRLLLSDECSFTELAGLIIQARDEFVAGLREHDNQQEQRPVAGTGSSATDSSATMG